MNKGVVCLFLYISFCGHSFFLDMHLAVELLDHKIGVCLNLLKESVFQSCTILCYCLQIMSPILPHPHQYLALPVFLKILIIFRKSVVISLCAVFTCIYLINDNEHLFICLLVILDILCFLVGCLSSYGFVGFLSIF